MMKAISNDHDELEIRVRSGTSCNSLAAAIVGAWDTGKPVVLCAIGPSAISQSVKGVAVANRMLASRGVMLCMVPGLVNKEIHDRNTGHPAVMVVTKLRLFDYMGGE